MDLTSPSKAGSRASSRGSRRAGADSGLTSKNGISGFFLMATGQIESADVSSKKVLRQILLTREATQSSIDSVIT